MIKEYIANLIHESLKELGIEAKDIPDFTVEHPDELSHGDYATNVALILARKLKKNPVEFSKQLVEKMQQLKKEGISKIETAGPGFINFYLTDKFFESQTKEILKRGKKFGQSKILAKQKTIVEYTDPNPFKEFHIGHLMSNSIGEAISRTIEANGAKIKRACYQGDVGMHVAKALYGWSLLEATGNKAPANGTLLEKAAFLGKAYASGATEPEVGKEYYMAELAKLNKAIYERTDSKVNRLYDLGRKWSLDYFENIYKKFGTKFNYYFFESKTGKFGWEIVEKNIVNGIFEKSDKAIVFPGEKYDKNLHTRVFINSEGLPTYEAKELGLAKIKYDKYHYEKSIVITGNEVNDYFKVLLKALSLIYPELAAKTVHLSHGMLRLPEGKMSSRTGKVITAERLISDVQAAVLEKMKDRDFKEEEKKEVAEIVSIGAIKYSILKQVAGKDIIFDFDKSISFEGDSGPYLQYSCVRAQAILEKAKEEKIKISYEKKNTEVSNLEKILYRFPEIVERAGKEYAPHYLALYLTELASEFSSFYGQGKIVDKVDVNSPYKVALTAAFLTVMQDGLSLLGIKVPKRM